MSKYTHSSQGWQKNKNTHRRRRNSGRSFINKDVLFKNLLLTGVLFAFLGVLFLVILMAFASRNLPNPDSLTEREISQTTKIYDKTGDNLLYEIFGSENRTLKIIQEGHCKDDKKMEFDEEGIPLYAIQATIAAEDRNFCNHNGFDAKGFARAVLQNLRGNRVGGSTLTQQLVKNAILSNEKTFTRKIKELILALELERRYSKDEILQIYLNEIPYGSTYYGIEAASQNFYKKSVNELTIAEAATLASLPKATTLYMNNPDRLHARRDYILNGMKDLEFITESEYDEAVASSTPIQVQFVNIQAPHFVLFVKEQLEEEYGKRTVEEGGLKVITSLDYDMQMIAEEEVEKGVDNKGEQYRFTNASLVAIDPSNGHILSMVGSKDYFDDEIDGQVNVSTRLRQPGSSFKPIVYTKAFEMGYTPNTVLWDVVTDFSTFSGTYTPNNYDLKEHGPVRVRDALQWSLNIPAVKMVYMVGVENALDFATSLGYSSFSNHANFGLSIVLGGGEVKLLEHVNAYATFANKGVFNETVSILKIEDPDGEVVYELKERDGKKVIEENVVSTITHVLSDNNARSSVFGLSNNLFLGDRPVAAKTGTTNDNRDAWLVGYTPSLAAGVWAGNNDNTKMREGAGGSTVAGPIWNGFMRRALSGTAIEQFDAPTIEKTGKMVLDGSVSAQEIFIDKASGKRATEFTPDSYKEKRLFAEYHSILHYVNRDNLLGSFPKKPEKDGQYEAFEKGLANWIVKREEETGVKIMQVDPPTDFDDVHVPRNFPSVHLTSPSNNAKFTERFINVSSSATAPRGVARVEFYIDGLFLGSDSNSPFELSTNIPSVVSRGLHTIKAVAYDDIENSGSDTISIQVASDASSSSLDVIDPKNGQKIEKLSENYTVVVSLKNPQEYSVMNLYAQKTGGGSKVLIGQVVNPSSPFITVDWVIPKIGSWAISSLARPKDGSSDVTTAGIIVEVVEASGNKAPAETVDGEEPAGELFVPEEGISLF
jgi:membrane peptidoglycan carboxypeptidase